MKKSNRIQEKKTQRIRNVKVEEANEADFGFGNCFYNTPEHTIQNCNNHRPYFGAFDKIIVAFFTCGHPFYCVSFILSLFLLSTFEFVKK